MSASVGIVWMSLKIVKSICNFIKENRIFWRWSETVWTDCLVIYHYPSIINMFSWFLYFNVLQGTLSWQSNNSVKNRLFWHLKGSILYITSLFPVRKVKCQTFRGEFFAILRYFINLSGYCDCVNVNKMWKFYSICYIPYFRSANSYKSWLIQKCKCCCFCYFCVNIVILYLNLHSKCSFYLLHILLIQF